MCQSIRLLDEHIKINTVAEFIIRFGRHKLVWGDKASQARYQGASISELQFCLCGMEIEDMAKRCGYRLVAPGEDGFDSMDHVWVPTSGERNASPNDGGLLETNLNKLDLRS